MSASRFTALMGGAAFSLLIIACQPKDDFAQCATTEKMQADCKTAISGRDLCSNHADPLAGVFCYDSCVVRDHPQCVEGPCILYEVGLSGDPLSDEPRPVINSGDTSFCTVPCHGEGCAGGTTCSKVLSLRTACTKNTECMGNSPWSRCETARFCETSRKECETDVDCAGQKCLADETVAKSCTFKFCIPNRYDSVN